MRCYSADDEERIRTEAAVREWTRSGLLGADQGATLAAEVRVELRRTNPFLRAALALFTAIIVAAAVGLIFVVLEVRSESGTAAVTLLAAVACYGLAERSVALLRLYRFGVEEMLAVAAVVLACISVVAMMSAGKAGPSSLTVMPLAVGALGGFGLFVRFGFLYGAAGALVCVAAMPFQVDAPVEVQRLLAAAMCVAAFAFTRAKTREHRDDYLGQRLRRPADRRVGGDVSGAQRQNHPRVDGGRRLVLLVDLYDDMGAAADRAGDRHSRPGAESDRRQRADAARDNGDEQAVSGVDEEHLGSDRPRRRLDRCRGRASALAGERARRRAARVHLGAPAAKRQSAALADRGGRGRPACSRGASRRGGTIAVRRRAIRRREAAAASDRFPH